MPDKPQKLAWQETCAVRQDSFSKVHDKFVTADSAFSASRKGVRNETSQVFRDAQAIANRRKKPPRHMRFFLSVSADLRQLNAAQIIYIFARLVTKKDVTVQPKKASPGGDMHRHQMPTGIGIAAFATYS